MEPLRSETIWRVCASIGTGYPLCTKRETKVRRFASEKGAAAWVAIIEGMPSHHQLITIERGDITYAVLMTPEALDLPPVGCSRCGLIPAPPGACPTCGERARFVAHASRDDDE